MAEKRERYGLKWDLQVDDLQIEMKMIQKGGYHTKTTGEIVGKGLPFHYEQMRRILWPHLDGEKEGQRWHVLCRDTCLENKITVLMGAGSTGKTHSAAWLYLCEYLCFPEDTCVLVSSTDIRGLKKRVWGEITSLWSKAIERFDYLPGNMLDAAIAIATDSLEDVDFGERKVRDMRKGIFGVPCMNSNNTFVGLTKYHGIKQKRLRLIADEASMMGISFLNSFANLNNNEDFRAIILGNPADPFDPLGKAAEPLDGWDGAHMNPTKTAVWKTKFMRGACCNLVGTDSPNFDFPADQPTRFKYLISREKIAETITGFQADSYEYHNQVLGTMMTGQLARRVLTHRICDEGHATDTDVNWEGSPRIKVYFVDAAYGGDRCVAVWGEFGKIVGGSTILLLHPTAIIPISPKSEKEPEQQIAEYVHRECEGLGIPPENMGHDATGRGSLGTYLAREWSPMTNPIESGGAPTDRPVSLDLFITEPDRTSNGLPVRRLKLCREHYIKRISEFWFSVRYAVIAKQVRGMTPETIDEFCQREWDRVSGDKIEIESKLDMKDRMGRSPDLADAVAGIVEMARRKGFMISKLANQSEKTNSRSWFDDLAREQRKLRAERELVRV